MPSDKKHSPIIYFLVIIFLLTYFKNVAFIMESVEQALLICKKTLIPSLFIFMVFSSYISKTRAKKIVGIPTKFFCKLLKVDDYDIACCVTLSLLGGFAVGASFLSELYENKKIEKNLIHILSILMTGNSISFVIFGVGIGMMNNYHLGIFIYLSLLISNFITAFIFSFFIKYKGIYNDENMLYTCCGNPLVASVKSSVTAMINICGYVILFYAACNVVSLYTTSDNLFVIICSFLEVTTASIKAIEVFNSNPYIICIVLSLIPACTIMQIKSFFSKDFKLYVLLLSRIIQIPIAFSFSCNFY